MITETNVNTYIEDLWDRAKRAKFDDVLLGVQDNIHSITVPLTQQQQRELHRLEGFIEGCMFTRKMFR